MTLLHHPSATEDAADLLDRYEEGLAEALADAGRRTALAETGLDEADIEAILEGDRDAVAEITVEEAAELLAVEGHDPEGLLAEVRDELLLSMTSAVMDVERLATKVEADLTPKEIQAKVEGRHPMTLGEYAALRAALAQ